MCVCLFVRSFVRLFGWLVGCFVCLFVLIVLCCGLVGWLVCLFVYTNMCVQLLVKHLLPAHPSGRGLHLMKFTQKFGMCLSIENEVLLAGFCQENDH